jgi:5-hydroxyisourate hydrolase
MSAITTHILDTSLGRPAANVLVTLDVLEGDQWRSLGSGQTDKDGRLRTLLPDGVRPQVATHRLRFATGAYFQHHAVPAFFPHVEIFFAVTAPEEHHHVPLLLSPFGYSTYRGS